MKTSHDTLDTLELYITRHDAASQTYKVNVTLEGGRMFDGLLRLDTLPTPPSPGNDASIRAYGNALFKRLFAGSLDNAFYQAWATAQAKNHGLRLRLWLDNVEDTQLHMVPWELLHYHPTGDTTSEPVPLTTANQSAFSRYLASSEYEGKPLERLPIRMLIVVSDPSDAEEAWGLKPIGKQEMQNKLDLLFQPIRESNQLEYHFLSPTGEGQLVSATAIDGNNSTTTAQQSFPASAQRLQEALQVQDGYDIVLYFGHALVHPTRGTRLLLEDHVTGQGRLYDGVEMVRLLKQASYRPRLILLMACNTAVALPTSNTAQKQNANSSDSKTAMQEHVSTASLAAQLVQQGGIPSVIAMQRPMGIDAGRTFTYRLCVRLLQHGVVDIAVNAARQFVFKPDEIDWSTPVLYMRMQDGRLFSTLPQMSYAQKILSNPSFTHWKGPEFINRDVIIVPAGQEWTIVRKHPEDAPSSQDALQIMKQLLIQHIQQTIDEERTTASMRKHQQWYTQVLDKPPLPNMLAFIGYPHSGLTVIMMRATIDLAEAAINVVSKVGLLHRPIGIFVKLRDYETQRISSRRMERLIIDTTTDVEPDLGKTLSRIFEQNTTTNATTDTRERFVFLLDGLDDITESHRQVAAEQITELAERLPQHLFAVSCNSYVFHSRMLRKPKMLIILPLNERQVLRYLQRRNPQNYRDLYRQIVESRLLNMTTDPDMMNVIYERITQDNVTTMSRNQLAHDYLSRMLQSIPALYEQGDVARRTLIALAWESRWRHKDTLPIQDVFAVMAQVRKERDYSLEDLYQQLQQSYLILNIGQHETRFLLPTLQAYSAALALVERPDIAERLEDILVMCSLPNRLRWWEETIYTLVELLPNPALLFQKLVTFTRYNSSPHILLAARALEALPDKVEHLMDEYLRQELLDACILQLDVVREPSTERRANIVTALGRVYLTHNNEDDNITAQLGDTQIKNKLIQLLTQPVRQTPNGPRYEYTTVRIAAARALYTRYAIWTDHMERTQAQADIGTANETNDVGNLPVIISTDLDPLLRAWKHHDCEELGRIFRCAKTAPERAIAAFALGDLAYNADVKLLLDMVVCPQRMQSSETEPVCDVTLLDDWSDTCWAAADSLTLFDAMQVSFQLSRIFQDGPEPSEISVQPLIYLVGRVRLRDVHAIRWLIGILRDHPDFAVKAKALQSLAWVSDALDRLDEPVPELETLLPKDEVLQANRSHGLVAVLRRVFEYVVFWDKKKLAALVGVSEDEIDTTIETQEQQQAVSYLCRKAIEALTWIGDSTTIAHIQPRIRELTPELREYWYTAAAAITSRMDSRTNTYIDSYTLAHTDAPIDFHA